MGFYEDMEKSLLEAIEIEKGNIPVVQKENMPAPTFIAANNEKELIDEVINIRKMQNISQRHLADIAGSRQQVISRMEQKENSPSLKLFCNILSALGYELQIIKKKE